jgi:hypothetical protein
MVSNFFRKKFQAQSLNKIFLPGSLTSRRMFLNHVGFFDLLSKNGSNYFWYSGSHFNIMQNDRFFFKTPILINNSGNSILKNNSFNADLKELQQIYLLPKNSDQIDSDLLNFNFLFSFGLCLDLLKNQYSILIYLYVYLLNT